MDAVALAGIAPGGVSRVFPLDKITAKNPVGRLNKPPSAPFRHCIGKGRFHQYMEQRSKTMSRRAFPGGPALLTRQEPDLTESAFHTIRGASP